MSSWSDLPAELRDAIMLLVHAAGPVYSLLLGNTCKAECARYRRLIPKDEQLTVRDLKVDVAFAEGTVVAVRRRCDPNPTAVIPGDPEYEWKRSKEAKASRKDRRKSWERPMALAKKHAKTKALRHAKAQWKRGRDADGEDFF